MLTESEIKSKFQFNYTIRIDEFVPKHPGNKVVPKTGEVFLKGIQLKSVSGFQVLLTLDDSRVLIVDLLDDDESVKLMTYLHREGIPFAFMSIGIEVLNAC